MEIKKINHHQLVSVWLLSMIILVFLMIVVGGLTRLTDSGLSITEWELFKGILPPLSKETWTLYFNLYKEIPQFKYLNPSMTIEEFKVIFYWEYFHRLLGRIIGLMFLIPLIYISFKKIVEKKVLNIFYLIFFLILFQGLLGWYMVESGLTENTTVSHYRLSLHLFFAFIIISLLYWNYLNFKFLVNKSFFNFKNILTKLLFLLILFQIIIGAFVSGLDAGMIYQTWPKMNHSYFPDDINIFEFNLFNFFDNQSFVQFLHRSVAYLIIGFVIFIGIKMLINKQEEYYKNYFIVFFILLIQVLLGIFTLISGLNLYLASLHQITSVILVFSVLKLNHKLS
jgi:cytochrome c oxidase assembly protein subunit 15